MSKAIDKNILTGNIYIPSLLNRYGVGFVLFLVAVIYIRVFNHEITNWDDDKYILENPFIGSLTFDNLQNTFSTFFQGNYHPLTIVSLAIDYQIGGKEPFIYLFTNLILHLLNTLLVFKVSKELIHFCSDKIQNIDFLPLIITVLFGIHTLHVESVAWVSERKNVLYTVFFLYSILWYIKYLNKSTYNKYAVSLVLFCFSLLSKGTAVTLPIVLFLIDYLKGRNLVSKKVILEKAPFLLLSVLFGLIAIKAQSTTQALWNENHFFWFERVIIAGFGFFQYILKLIIPIGLSAYYPYPVSPGGVLPTTYYLYAIFSFLLFIIIGLFARKDKLILFGALFFIINLSPVIQLFPVGDAIMADRYIYVPSIGFFFILGYALILLFNYYQKLKLILVTSTLFYIILLGILTFNRIGVWENSLTLWNDALAGYPQNNFKGNLNRANYLYKQGKYDESLINYLNSIHINPFSSEAYIGVGLIKKEKKDLQDALSYFDSAIMIHPTYEGYINRAALKMLFKDYSNAMSDLNKASEMDSLRIDMYVNKGFVFLENGYLNEAFLNFSKALTIDPLNYNSNLGLGRTKQKMNDLNGALNNLNLALSSRETGEAYICRADIKMAMGDINGSKDDLEKALVLQPSKLDIYINMGMLELSRGNVDIAFQYYDKAVSLNKNNPQAYFYRALAKMENNRYKEALADMDTSISLKPYAQSYYYRGLINAKLGNTKNTSADLKQSAHMGYKNAELELKKKCK